MRLLSWNVAGRQRAALSAQAHEVLGTDVDVIALQEVTAKTFDVWRTTLDAEGYSVVSSLDLLAKPYPGKIARKNLNLIAARGRIEMLPGLRWPDPKEGAVAFPEKHVAARIVLNDLEFELHNAHLPPGSSRDIIKPQAFKAIRRRIDEPTDVPQILCGDFNSPKAEDDDGVTPAGQLHPGVPWWGNAEREILLHPRLKDLYRLHRERGSEFAVSHRTRGGSKRYDHVYADPEEWASLSCSYRTEWLDARLSDHAAVEAELQPK